MRNIFGHPFAGRISGWPSASSRGNGRSIIVGTVVCAIAAFTPACRESAAFEKPAIPVRVEVAQTYSGAPGVRYSATISPNRQVDLGFRTSGYVQQILQVRDATGSWRTVQEGDHVAAGTVLARLRETDYSTKTKQAEAQLAAATSSRDAAQAQEAEARSALAQASLAHSRALALYSNQSLTRPEFDSAQSMLEMAQARFEAAQSQLRTAEASIRGAEAQLEEARTALDDCALKAPIDGVILKRTIETGVLVGHGTPCFVLADTSLVKGVFGVPDRTMLQLKPGSSLILTTQALPDAEFRGRISGISPVADPASRVFEVEVSIANQEERLKVGMIAALEVPEPSSSMSRIVVPLTAVVRLSADREDYTVFVTQVEGGRVLARRRNVRLGQPVGNMIAINEGVEAGEQVIVSGTMMVRDGDTVRVVS
jgi:RND family efflux transporter MFP subunit